MERVDSSTRTRSHLYAFGVILAILIAIHIPYLSVPYFWDELGQFVPASLDLLQTGAWIPHSTVPNVHPPAVMAYLAMAWKFAGISVPATRVAMLAVAAFGLYATFLLAIRMCRHVPGAPAFHVAVLMLATPLFFMQAMMAQLDMPAMAMTTLALYLFIEGRYRACTAACTLLVLTKETGALAPLLFGAWLMFREKKFREAAWFAIPLAALAAWLVFLKSSTGHWLGDTGFAHYNVEYALSPVRIAVAFFRRVWFLFGADFRWIGTLGILYGLRRTRLFHTREWALGGLFFAGHVSMVSLLGGATLERYLLPVFPILYIAVATGWSAMDRLWRRLSFAALTAGLAAGLYWNPPYPFPPENNLAMVDFVELQQAASQVLERDNPGAKVASAWPYTAGLYRTDLGFIHRPFRVVETGDLHAHSVIDAVRRENPDVLVLYSRTWEPRWNLMKLPYVETLLRTYYDYEPQITPAEVEEKLGMRPRVRFSQRGQWVEIYDRARF